MSDGPFDFGAAKAAEARLIERRERIATAVLNGLLAFNAGEWTRDLAGAAKTACLATDALIAELDR